MGDALVLTELSDVVGAEVLHVDRERLVQDPDLPDAVLEALERYGVLVFRDLGVDDEEQVAFGKRLGELVRRPGTPIPEVHPITQGPDDPLAEYFRGNLLWHIDGALDGMPNKAGILTARVISPGDGGTEFASTYAAYDDLSAEEQERFAELRVIHTMEATLRPVYDDPTPEMVAGWRKRPPREHPLVWVHESGRRSLVIGATADHVVGMDVDEGRALLVDLVQRATGPDRVLRHDWSVGDLVIWDNCGLLHRVTDHDPESRRELHRSTLLGNEPIR